MKKRINSKQILYVIALLFLGLAFIRFDTAGLYQVMFVVFCLCTLLASVFIPGERVEQKLTPKRFRNVVLGGLGLLIFILLLVFLPVILRAR